MSSAQIPVTVATASGQITGVRRDGLHYFHSVRYSTIPSPYSPAEPFDRSVDQDAREPHPEDIALSITTPADANDCPVGSIFTAGATNMDRTRIRGCRGKRMPATG